MTKGPMPGFQPDMNFHRHFAQKHEGLGVKAERGVSALRNRRVLSAL
jgi:hypothetical protein